MPSTALFGPVTENLERVEEEIALAARTDFPLLAKLLQHILSQRGKRIRPALVLLAATFTDSSLAPLIKLAAGVEILHTATLVHDDMIDGADTRRGVKTLHNVIDPHSSVLVGDYLFAKAAALCAEAGNVRAVQIFGRTLMTICDGELRQLFTARAVNQSREEYYNRIISKTASLFETACETGAIVSGASEKMIKALADYGLNVGMAFQIVDDVLDFVGDKTKLGKPVGGDLKCGILTLPALWHLAEYPDSGTIERVFSVEGDEETDRAVEAAVRAIVGSDAIIYSLGVAREHTARAKEALAALPDTPARQTLFELADYIVDRDY